MANEYLEGMFGNRFDTKDAIDTAIFDQAAKMGSLDRTRYAPMTASTWMQGLMYGQSLGGLMGGVHPMMAKQNLLDEIKKRHPDPTTPAQMKALAADLSANGFGDLAMEVTKVGMELDKIEVSKGKALATQLKPTAAAMQYIPNRLYNIVKSTDIENAYLRLKGAQTGKDLINYNPMEWQKNKQGWTDARKDHLADMKGVIDDFSASLDVAGFNMESIRKALSDDDALANSFISWIQDNSNQDVVDDYLIALGRTRKTDKTSGDSGGLGVDEEYVAPEVTKANYPLTHSWSDDVALKRMRTLEGQANLSQFETTALIELKARFPEATEEFKDDNAWWWY